MTTKTIAKRMSAIEKELRQLELRLKRRAARGKKPPLTELRGLWKSCGDIGEDEIRRVEVRLAAHARRLAANSSRLTAGHV